MGSVLPQLTCLNCHLSFKNAGLQREHYKTDWHRYNLKRNVSELPPVTDEEYQRRVQLLRAENENKLSPKSHTYCVVCKKSFASHHSFENHLRSKKHVNGSQSKSVDEVAQPSIKNAKPAVPIVSTPSTSALSTSDSIESDSSDTEELDSDEWEEIISENNPILYNNCLFCTHHSASLGKNVRHMSQAHSFFLPYVEYLVDLEGLLMYLGEKICQGFMCIWCSDKKNSFSSIEAVRSHMIDKGHTKIPFDTDASLEYLDFYDFELNVDEEEENETNVDDSTSVVVEKQAAPSVDDRSTVTMLLPSGEVICHRSLIRYFRQNTGPKNKSLAVKRNKVQKLINYYRDLGWNPTEKEAVKKKARDIKYINYIRSKYETRLKVKSNKLQRYFRPQVDF